MPTQLPDLDQLRDSVPEEPDPQAVASFNAEGKAIENDLRREEVASLRQDRDQRKQYSSRLFWLVVGWLIAVGGVLLLHGFNVWSFELTEIVLTTLISTTTASVLGLFTIVARYLFRER